jgi:catechol 2,3-dioxygenase-like lactoylglutathione lyase family enzyme
VAIKDVFHVNVNCTDLERSRAFYELVGFKAVVELGVGGSADMLRGLGLPEGSKAKAVLMMLEPDKPRGTRIDLIEWIDPPTKGTPAPDLAHAGAVRIALWTIGIDEEYQRLRDKGVEFLSEPVPMPNGTRFCCFKDPDGTILELIDFSPAKQSGAQQSGAQQSAAQQSGAQQAGAQR